MEMKIPQSLQAEHDEIRASLRDATKAGGLAGSAAKAAEKLMQPHLSKEEEIAMPILSLLPDLASRKVPQHPDTIIAMVERLRVELPEMIREHRAINDAMETLKKVAEKEEKPEQISFAQKVVHHAAMEEEVLYPAAVIAGEYLKLKVPQR